MLAAVITEGLDAEKSWIHQHINIYPPKLPQLPTSLSSLGLHYQQNKVWNSPSSVTHNKLPCLVPMPLIGTRTWNIVNVNAIKQLKLSRTSLIRSIVYFKQPLYIVERERERAARLSSLFSFSTHITPIFISISLSFKLA